jgi:virulence-associated protein VapD
MVVVQTCLCEYLVKLSIDYKLSNVTKNFVATPPMSQRDSVHEILVHNPLFHDTVEYADVNRFSSDMYDLVNNDLLSDIVFEVGPEKTKIYGHKVILCQRSVYFKQMFVTSHMREMNSNTVVKPNVDVETFLKVLRFLYSGRVHLSRSTTADALHVLAAADEMQILDLKRMCVEHVKYVYSSLLTSL